MKILLLGGGGREHAIGWALAKSTCCTSLHSAPGNPGLSEIGSCYKVDICDPHEVSSLAKKIEADLVVVGPEAPLVSGVSNRLREDGFPVFGPNSDGAMLEGSKAFSKNFMRSHGIATAAFDICTTMEEAELALSKRSAPYIVKADGLAAGKGVFVTDDLEEALEASRSLLVEKTLGEAGSTVVIEDGLLGQELSVMIITDGKEWRLLHFSQDHKRAFDGDKGPNTGGMGAYAPVPWVTEDMTKRIEKEVVEPTLKGLIKDGIDYRGVIYAGLMIQPDGRIMTLEYNVRLGDPETQVLMPLFNEDWAKICYHAATGNLRQANWSLSDQSAVNIVIASGGYPGKYEKGREISGIEEVSNMENVILFHAGTTSQDNKIVTSGGRVLSCVGLGSSIEEAREKAVKAAESISFDGAFFRRDIARRGGL